MTKKKILIHACCAPCLIAPYFHLQENGFHIYVFWYNHNIHPYTEYQKRLRSLQDFVKRENIPFILKDEYDLEKFLRRVAFREENRCNICYYDRLNYAAIVAKKGKFDAFTTTLLYSKFQQHKLIIEIANSISKKQGIPFYYQDFREYWKEGIALSKKYGMYRQQYCGCIYSERDRYLKT